VRVPQTAPPSYRAVAFDAEHGTSVERVISDNGNG
jgi:hypothetical protein